MRDSWDFCLSFLGRLIFCVIFVNKNELLGSSDPEAVRQTVLDLTDKAVALTRYVFWIKDDEDPEKGRELSALVDKAFVIEGEKTA